MQLDLEFPVFSTSAIAVDHGYHLYAGLSKALATVHSENGIAVHPITGRQIGDRMLQLMPWSIVKVRTPQERIGDLVGLAGKTVTIGDRQVRLGVPKVQGLEPATALRSRLVTIKGFMDAETFAQAVRRQLDALEISERVILTIGNHYIIAGSHPGNTCSFTCRSVAGYDSRARGHGSEVVFFCNSIADF